MTYERYWYIYKYTLLQVNQMTYEPMHSAQAQSVRVTEKIYFLFVGHHCRDITSEDKCIFYSYFRAKSLRFSYRSIYS